jgi:Zn finger protein HypA/HybF involved in hydrogenase expression
MKRRKKREEVKKPVYAIKMRGKIHHVTSKERPKSVIDFREFFVKCLECGHFYDKRESAVCPKCGSDKSMKTLHYLGLR